MELKQYQSNTLDAFTRWLRTLDRNKEKIRTLAEALGSLGHSIPNEISNYPRSAWKELTESAGVAETAGEYVSRTDGAGRPIPHVCLKVPTGGGKTLLAAAALERMNRQNGLTLWIVPTKAIYQQTKKALWNKEHPYRQMLEQASGGRVKVLEKETPFSRADVEHYLCVMLLMLPAANRQKGRDFLRMFRDSGRYPTFFPDSDDPLGDGRLLEHSPDLERTGEYGPVKHSLFNVFKMMRPVVVLDEAHKAYGPKREDNQEFVRSINRLDPRMVLELSATPNRGVSNLLVDVTGVELKNEEMIKLPVQVTSFTEAEWQFTLAQAVERLESLEREAQSFQSSEGSYIRPIAVVRVERTGKDQRDGEHIHAEDVREYLTQNLDIPADCVRVKSSESDELGKDDLLSEYSPVRWIITKAALMEGWDCPFAYVLVMLDNTRAQRALTQLVGRVMRQPHARRTQREALDQCYVYCMNTDVGVAVQQVKNGLEQEGLTGLGGEVVSESGELHIVSFTRQKKFQGRDIFLPMVLHRTGDEYLELDYQRHILPSISWGTITAPDPQSALPSGAKVQMASVDVGDEPPVFHGERDLYIDKTVQVSWFARRLSDIVPNPWQAARVTEDLLRQLREAGETDESIYDQRSSLTFQLREHVTQELDKQAEEAFRSKLRNRDIRFDLEAVSHSFRMVESFEMPVPDEADLLGRRDGRPLQLNLFEPVYSHHFDSSLERNFARYLDEQKALQWWHRVAVRQRSDYYLRGWKQDRIWPDFVAMAGPKGSKAHVLVFETKGEHLKGNPDTDYKTSVLETLENAFNCGTMRVCDGPAKGTFRLVFSEDEFPIALSNLSEAYKA